MTMIPENRQKVQIIGAGNVIKVIPTMLVTGASGGQALGSGRTTSGFVVNRVVVTVPTVQSGTNSYGFFINSGNTSYGVWIGGMSGDAPYPGSGVMASGKGLFISPGQQLECEPISLNHIYAAAETSGNPLTYLVEMVQVQV